MSKDAWSAAGSHGSSGLELLREFQWLAIAVVLAVAMVVGGMLLRGHPNPAPANPVPAYPDLQQQAHENGVACMEGGGTWTGYTCQH